MTDQAQFPTSAQMKKEIIDIKSQIAEILKAMNLRIKSVELAAQFKTDDPMKLTKEIYHFLSINDV